MNTFKIEIELPTEFSFSRSGQPMTVNPADLSPAMCAEYLCHGIVQKVGDSGAGKEGKEAKDAMVTTWTRTSGPAGEWTGRKPGGASDEHGAYRKHIRDIMRPAVKARDGKATIESIDEAFDGLADAKRDAVVKTAKARAEREAVEAASLTIEL